LKTAAYLGGVLYNEGITRNIRHTNLHRVALFELFHDPVYVLWVGRGCLAAVKHLVESQGLWVVMFVFPESHVGTVPGLVVTILLPILR